MITEHTPDHSVPTAALPAKSSKRLFIGIEFTSGVKQRIAEISRPLIEASQKGRFTDPENYHLTLYFIGETEPEAVSRWEMCLHEAARGQTPFDLILEGTGYFQRRRRKILWIGAQPSLALDMLNHGLMQQVEFLASKVQKPENKNSDAVEKHRSLSLNLKPFIPHITLGREVLLENEKAISKTNEIPVHVEAITLFESVRINGRLVYRPIARCRL
jgi:2'-5' RNA ligase